MRPHKCPICNGDGIKNINGMSNSTKEFCQSCDGTGIIWENSENRENMFCDTFRIKHCDGSEIISSKLKSGWYS